MNQATKMKHRWQITSLVFAFLFGTGMAYADATIDGREIAESLNNQWNEAFNSADPSSVAALYDENAVLSPGNGKVLVGKEAIEGLFRSFIDNGVHGHSIDLVSAHINGNNLYEIAKWSAYGVANEGQRPVYQGILINVFQRDEKGQWKSHAHVWNVAN